MRLYFSVRCIVDECKMRVILFLAFLTYFQIVASMLAIPKSVKDCPLKDSKVLFGKLEKLNRTHVSYTGNFVLPMVLDDKVDIHVQIAAKSLGTWKENFFNFHMKKGCSDIKNVLPQFLLQTGKAATNSTYNGGCPIPKGTMYIDHLVPVTSLYIPPTPKGEYKATITLTKGNKKGCAIVDFDLAKS